MHNVFLDDLKLHLQSLKSTKKQLDTNMKSGEDKICLSSNRERKMMQKLEPISITSLTIKPVEEGNNYKYLRTDENVSYNGPINKLPREYVKELTRNM